MTRKYSNNMFEVLIEDDEENFTEHKKKDPEIMTTDNLFIENVDSK